MVEVLPGGGERTPSVWDLHLHHVVWLKQGGGPTFASGEEKTHVKLPQGYGIRAEGGENWTVNHMIHNLTAVGGRQVYLTWEIDWVPVDAEADIADASIRWLDVAGLPQIYPVFDAERGFDRDGDDRWTFPDDVPTDPSVPGYEEREKISSNAQWTVPSGGRTLVFTAGHLHPGRDERRSRRSPATERPCRCSGRGRGTTTGQGRSAGTSAWARPGQSGGCRWSRGTWSRSAPPTRWAGRRGTSRWGSCRWRSPRQTIRPRGIRSTTRRRSRRCTSRAASSRTAACPRTSTRRRARICGSPTRAS